MNKKIGFDLVSNPPFNEFTDLVFDAIKACPRVQEIPKDYIQEVIVKFTNQERPVILTNRDLIANLYTDEDFYTNVKTFMVEKIDYVKIVLDMETISLYLDVETEDIIRNVRN